MFDKKGYIVVENDAVDEDALMEIAIEAGAEDVREDDSNYEIITAPQDFESVKAAIDKESITYIAAEITMLPQSTVNLQGNEAHQMIKLMETLEDSEDVQKVYTNADIPEELVIS
jgi:transcriptional/translational regulatory protein YebC/TACO1